jgi:hypothetical protein
LYKRAIIIVVVVISGFMIGYFSNTIYNFIWNIKDSTSSGLAVLSRNQQSQSARPEDKSGETSFVSEGDAIDVVKKLSFVERITRVAELDGSKVSFSTDQEPTAENPVWMVEFREDHPDKVPDILYFQVDAVSGKILELTSEELKISGIFLDMTRREVDEIQGRPEKNRKTYDKELKMNIRTYDYPGLEIVFDNKGKVIKIKIFGSDVAGPRGIKVGAAKANIIKLFGKARLVGADFLQYSSMDDKNISLTFKVNNNNTIEEMTLERSD